MVEVKEQRDPQSQVTTYVHDLTVMLYGLYIRLPQVTCEKKQTKKHQKIKHGAELLQCLISWPVPAKVCAACLNQNTNFQAGLIAKVF